MVTVLLVEDDPIQLTDYTERLQMLSCKLITAISAREVFDLLQAGFVFDVVVCDNQLPYFTSEQAQPNVGLELYSLIRERKLGATFILHTSDELEDLPSHFDTNDMHYLQKDGSVGTLEKMVSRAIKDKLS